MLGTHLSHGAFRFAELLMSELGPEWITYGKGERVKCPGRRLDRGRRRDDRGQDRRQQCRRIFAQVGADEIYHVRWLGDRERPMRVPVLGSTMECWDCHTLVEVKVVNLPAAQELAS